MLLQMTNYILKSLKKNAIRFKLFWYKVFFTLKIKITQFPSGFRLKIFVDTGISFGYLAIEALV